VALQHESADQPGALFRADFGHPFDRREDRHHQIPPEIRRFDLLRRHLRPWRELGGPGQNGGCLPRTQGGRLPAQRAAADQRHAARRPSGDGARRRGQGVFDLPAGQPREDAQIRRRARNHHEGFSGPPDAGRDEQHDHRRLPHHPRPQHRRRPPFSRSADRVHPQRNGEEFR